MGLKSGHCKSFEDQASMMTSSNGNILRVIAGSLWEEVNPPVTDRFPWQRPVTRSFDVFFELRLNKQLSKQSRCRWFETPSRLLWRHCYARISYEDSNSCNMYAMAPCRQPRSVILTREIFQDLRNATQTVPGVDIDNLNNKHPPPFECVRRICQRHPFDTNTSRNENVIIIST